MRKPRFRVWSELNKAFFRPYSFNLSFNGEIVSRDSLGLVILEQQNKCIVQQFTGLQDAKGEDIYEGDIVTALSSDNQYRSKIVWVDSEARFGAESIPQVRLIKGKSVMPHQTTSFNLTMGCSRWNVIGNIFENPELLK